MFLGIYQRASTVTLKHSETKTQENITLHKKIFWKPPVSHFNAVLCTSFTTFFNKSCNKSLKKQTNFIWNFVQPKMRFYEKGDNCCCAGAAKSWLKVRSLRYIKKIKRIGKYANKKKTRTQKPWVLNLQY